MQKLAVVYSVAGLVLFGALFAVFALAGIGRPAVATPEVTATTMPESDGPARNPLDFVPPEMEAGRTYRISHDLPIYDKPDTATAQRETLPAGGFFTAVYTLTDVPGPWTQITVNNGFRDYNMYLLGTDLRWKIITAVYSDDEQRDQRIEAMMKIMRDSTAAKRAQREAMEAVEEEVTEAPTFSEWWADRAERMGGATVANFVVAGLASVILTVSILGSIVALTLLRREHEWSRPAASYDEDAIDLQPEDEDPFTYSKGGSAYAAHDDEDPRRA